MTKTDIRPVTGAVSTGKLLVVERRGFFLAFAMGHVVEVTPFPVLRRVPLTRPHLLGYGRWRDSLIPVLDPVLSWIEDPAPGRRSGEPGGIAVLSAGPDRFGIALDRTIGIVSAESPALPVPEGPASEARFLTGRIRVLGGREALLIDAVAFREEELG